MGRKFAKFIIAALVIIALIIFALWATSPDPRGNPASFEDTPLAPALAPLEEAITLAQIADEDGQVRTLLVTAFDDETVTGVEIAALGAPNTGNPLADSAAINPAMLTEEALEGLEKLTVGYEVLLPSAPGGAQHIGTGTNFPEHAAEASSDAVFQFPKFGEAGAARTSVAYTEGILLDYEVELCMRFDRDIESIEDFDAAVKGVFLCGDFTNRNALVELADPDNLDSGYGFSDAKSGPGSYPSGPFIVAPRDWESFVDDLRMTTSVNGEPRQDARGSEMTMDFRELARKALGDMVEPRFAYGDGFVRLAPEGKIESEMTLMSGTSEGVIFTPPSRADYIEGGISYLGQGGPFGAVGFVDAIKRRFIRNELEQGHFLKPGDTVEHGSNRLGNIIVTVE